MNTEAEHAATPEVLVVNAVSTTQALADCADDLPKVPEWVEKDEEQAQERHFDALENLRELAEKLADFVPDDPLAATRELENAVEIVKDAAEDWAEKKAERERIETEIQSVLGEIKSAATDAADAAKRVSMAPTPEAAMNAAEDAAAAQQRGELASQELQEIHFPNTDYEADQDDEDE